MNEVEQKSLRLPKSLVEKVKEDAEKNHRNFTQQVIHIITKYYEIKD